MRRRRNMKGRWEDNVYVVDNAVKMKLRSTKSVLPLVQQNQKFFPILKMQEPDEGRKNVVALQQ